MSPPQWPDDASGRQNLPRPHERTSRQVQSSHGVREGAWWPEPRTPRSGGFLRGLATVLCTLVTLWAAMLALGAPTTRSAVAVVLLVSTLMALLVTRRMSRWARPHSTGSAERRRGALLRSAGPTWRATLDHRGDVEPDVGPGLEPLAPAPWYLAEEDRQEGPLTADEVVERIRDGALTRAGYVRRPGMDGWAPVAMHPDFEAWFETDVQQPTPPGGLPAGVTVPRSVSGSRATQDAQVWPSPTNPEAPGRVGIPRRFRRGCRGVARDVHTREPTAATGTSRGYLSFRLERIDDRGNVIEQIPVEMTGVIPARVLRNGDEVVVSGRRRGHRTIRPRAVYVVGSDCEIRPRPWST